MEEHNLLKEDVKCFFEEHLTVCFGNGITGVASSQMSNSLDQIVRETFGPFCGMFNLQLSEIDDDEFMLLGDGFAILIWFDRDGVSVYYFQTDQENLNLIDVCLFIAHAREWVPFKSTSKTSTLEDLWKDECAAASFNIKKYGTDILKGDTDWLNHVDQNPFPLSETRQKQIKSAVAKAKRISD